MKTDFDCVVVANGLFPTTEDALALLRNASFVIACDGAAQKLFEDGYRIDAIVGDLDSMPHDIIKKYTPNIHHLTEQMTNDLTKSVHYAHEKGYKHLLILGATGLREDHTIGNVSLLTNYINWFDSVQMMSDFGVFIPLKASSTLSSEPGQQISIFAVTPQIEITTTGLRWDVTDRRFECWWQGTLNEAIGTEFTLSFKGDGRVVVYKALVDYKRR
ncbi:thiamine diphosphokinase [Massilibacteroides sp.]|uniref:thiamine diphosphokinase n=1 Tax=Massilibacteroides sp. TaxID=2034766 RepID=UPI002625F11A|nr:thiamine diphosphokinase [Massilibacteroides sp.]MDD4513959.1 thiamine diphosphokinase [Massilibacteroides sp.]